MNDANIIFELNGDNIGSNIDSFFFFIFRNDMIPNNRFDDSFLFWEFIERFEEQIFYVVDYHRFY
jgi:hypothetical protein